MPAQTNTGPGVVYYAEGDTAPPLRVRLVDGNNDPIDLTGASVTINIGYARWSYYYAPTDLIVTDSLCVVDPDQINNRGWVTWTPGVGDLTPPGSFKYAFTITYADGGVQTVPANTYQPMHILTRVPGGNY